MGLSDEQVAAMKLQIRQRVEALAGEPVLAFGFFGYAGFIQEIGGRSQIARDAGAGSRLSSWFKGKKQAAGLPTQVILAATPTRVLAVAFANRASGVEPTEVRRSWDRASSTIVVSDDPATERSRARILLRGPDDAGDTQLDSYDMGSDVNDEVIALLRG
jgi:hypothetical protein